AAPRGRHLAERLSRACSAAGPLPHRPAGADASVPGAELAREPLQALEARPVEADDAHLLVAGGVLRLHRIEGRDGRGVPDVGLGEVDDHRRGVAGVVELVDEIVARGPEQLTLHGVATDVDGAVAVDVRLPHLLDAD